MVSLKVGNLFTGFRTESFIETSSPLPSTVAREDQCSPIRQVPDDAPPQAGLPDNSRWGMLSPISQATRPFRRRLASIATLPYCKPVLSAPTFFAFSASSPFP
jgi:hypothetical protein